MGAILHIEGKVGRRTFDLQNTATIGRFSDNQIVLEEDSAVSRHHAMIRRQEHSGQLEYWLIDIGSANGTYLNSKLVVGPARIKDGDIMRTGETTLRLEIQPLSAEEQKLFEETFVSHTRSLINLGKMVILVCDVRNFTRISEILPPDRLAKFIGTWFGIVAEIITNQNGIIDKFIGDAVMAYWPVGCADSDDSHEDAMAAARKIHEAARKIEIPGNPKFVFRVGVGLHEGLVFSGNIGTTYHPDNTIMGEAVNIAFRLESLCKIKRMPVVVSDEIKNALELKCVFVPLGKVKLKNVENPPQAFGCTLE